MTRKLIYATEKNLRGGVTVYGENGVRRYFCKSAAQAVRCYRAQAEFEDSVIEFLKSVEKHTTKYSKNVKWRCSHVA